MQTKHMIKRPYFFSFSSLWSQWTRSTHKPLQTERHRDLSIQLKKKKLLVCNDRKISTAIKKITVCYEIVYWFCIISHHIKRVLPTVEPVRPVTPGSPGTPEDPWKWHTVDISIISNSLSFTFYSNTRPAVFCLDSFRCSTHKDNRVTNIELLIPVCKA